MNIIETMPTYLGKQLYPHGLPIQADKVSVNGRTIKEIFLDTCDGDFREDDPNVKILNDYYRYYLLAPHWVLAGTTSTEIMNADSEKLFEICMENGLDPI